MMSSTPRSLHQGPDLNTINSEVESPVQSTSKKRPRQSSRICYPRKRALTACEVCRKRKAKCDNLRPECGACQRNGAQCVYLATASDHSTYDQASLEILERINFVADLLQKQQDRGNFNESPYLQTAQYTSSTTEHPSPCHDALDEAAILSESLEFAENHSGTCEDILEWPIFDGKYHRKDTESLIFSPDHGQSLQLSVAETQQTNHLKIKGPIRKSMPTRGIQDTDALALVERFLANVHIKNPILDPEELRSWSKDVMENGFSWSGSSCLVLLACALASLSRPFTEAFVTSEISNHTDSVSDAYEYSTAESYYHSAQKRLGLLDASILTTQCYFFCGVYEMYSLRPVKAWASFNRACITLQIYLRAKPDKEDPELQKAECRIYWSCLKSECEMRSEIRLPSSGLSKVNYPNVFPTPPCGSPAPSPRDPFAEGANISSHLSPSTLNPELEQSWGYYLADIAVRRIGNRVINSFYNDNENLWLSTPVERLIRIAEELNSQLTQWHVHLPQLLANLGHSYNSNGAEELRSLLHVRLLDFREKIHRPFIFLAIQHPAASPIQAVIEPYVTRCLDACVEKALKGCYRHRHHGTWYQNRKIFIDCLLILAAAKSRRVKVPQNWRLGVETCISGLRFGEREAPDLGKARLLLQSILADLDM